MIKGMLVNSIYQTDGNSYRSSVSDPSLVRHPNILSIDMLLDMPLTDAELEDLENMLGKRIKTHLNSQRDRVQRKRKQSKILKFRG